MVGVCVFGLQIALTKSYTFADATIIAPISYITLLWMLLLDLFIWGYIPKTLTLVGAGIIMISNFVIIYREAIKKVPEDEKLHQTGVEKP